MAHNGKRLQLNLWFLGLSAEYPFLNCLKLGQNWDYSNNSGFLDPADLDANGYPTVIRNLGARTQFKIASQADRPGNYVVGWTGNITVSFDGVLQSAVGTNTGLNGRAIYLPNGSTTTLQITAITAPITNIYVCHVNDEAALLAAGMFQSDFKNLVKEFGVTRFLDWGPFNTSTVTGSGDWKPETHWSYSADQYPSQYYAGTTTHSGKVYSASLTGFALADKARAILKFDADQTITSATVTLTNGSATIGWTGHPFVAGDRMGLSSSTSGGNGLPTNFSRDFAYYVSATNLGANSFEVSLSSGGASLVAASAGSGTFTGYTQSYLNIGGTGSKPILLPFGGARKTTPIIGGFWSNCIYDAALDGYLVNNMQFFSLGITNGVPPSVMIRLCNEVGSHPWFPSPLFTCDAPGNLPTLPSHLADLAALNISTLSSGLVPRYEVLPNEQWNFSFWAVSYASIREYLRNAATQVFDYNNWAGMVASLNGQILSTAYGADRSRYQAIVGFQTVTAPTTQAARLESTLYVSQGGSAAKNWVTHLCITGYWNSGYYGTTQESDWATAYTGADAATQASLIESYMLGAVDGALARFDTIPKIKVFFGTWQAFAATYGLKVCQYEGGPSPDYVGSLALPLNVFRAATKSSPLQAAYCELNWYNFLSAGTNCENPSEYMLSGPSADWSIWDPSIYAPTPARWTGVLLLNARRRRMSLAF